VLDGGDGFPMDGEWCSVAIDVVVSSNLSRVVRTPDGGKDVTVVVVVSLTGETIVSVEDRVVRDVVVHAVTAVVSIRVVIESITGVIVMTDDDVVVVMVVSASLDSFEISTSAMAEVATAVVSFDCVLRYSGRIKIKLYSHI